VAGVVRYDCCASATTPPVSIPPISASSAHVTHCQSVLTYRVASPYNLSKCPLLLHVGFLPSTTKILSLLIVATTCQSLPF